MKPWTTVPICAVCKKPVDRFEQSYDVLRQCHTFIAECHGQRQEALLDVMHLIVGNVEMTEAFAHKAIGS